MASENSLQERVGPAELLGGAHDCKRAEKVPQNRWNLCERALHDAYLEHARGQGLEYYRVGRAVLLHGFSAVGGKLFHDSIEMLIKAFLSGKDTLEDIRAYSDPIKGYGCDIVRLWSALKSRWTKSMPRGLDELVETLHAFEDIRSLESQSLDSDILRPPTLTQIDRLIGFLLEVTEPSLHRLR